MTAGTWQLIRVIVRRERVRITVWTIGLVTMVALSAQSVKGVFPTQADLDAAARSSKNPAVLAFQGPDQALDTLGGQVAFQIGAPGLVFMGLMALLMIGRMTRAEEEAGRLELVRSLPVARRAPLLAAGLVVTSMSVVIGAAVTVSLIALGLPVTGSVNYGLGYVAIGAAFAATTMLTAQVTENSRLANGIAGCALGVAFVLRAIGDMTDGPLVALAWCSPMGWVQRARPYAGDRWWTFVVLAAATGLVAWTAFRIQSRRDLGAGLVGPRSGRASGSERLATPLALTVRLQRGALVGWTAGVAFLALVYGSMTAAIESFVEDNPDLADFLQATGGNLTDAYLATAARTIALIGSGFAIQSILRLRSEETHDRAEPVLATRVSRRQYWLAHLAFTAAGIALELLVCGLVLGASAAVAVGDGGLVLRSTGASVSYLPAVFVLIGFAALLTGLVPRLTTIAWVALSAGFVVAMFGPILDLPDWAMRVSPFENLARVPAETFAIMPTIALTALAAAMLHAGLTTYRRRDIPT